ncbi:MAG: flagellar biosynthetic protein FliO [Deltaproteobacteria bacterium]|nr:flagellar biosynthetic protein FliO [Deltaproteobacteria bacterium]
MGILLQVGERAELPGGYGMALFQTLVALAAVSVLAWVVLKWSANRGLGTFAKGRRLTVLERVPLDARRSLYLVEVGGKVLLIGAGDGAAPTLLSELDPDSITEVSAPGPGLSFADVLGRLRGTGAGSAAGGSAAPDAKPKEES